MSLLKFGNTAWPPKGAIKIPMANKRSGMDCGQRFVGMMSNKDPGAFGFKNPQINTNKVIEMVDMIPNNENIDKIGKGTKVNGVNTTKLNSFRFVLVQVSLSLTRAYKESLNKTINDTPEPSKSMEKINEISNFAVEP